jgi:hypothetical protein
MCPRYEGRAPAPPLRVAPGSGASEPPQHRLPALRLVSERRHGDRRLKQAGERRLARLSERRGAPRRAPVAIPTDIKPSSKSNAVPHTTGFLSEAALRPPKKRALRAKKAGEGRRGAVDRSAPYGLGPGPPTTEVRGQAALTTFLDAAHSREPGCRPPPRTTAPQ